MISPEKTGDQAQFLKGKHYSSPKTLPFYVHEPVEEASHRFPQLFPSYTLHFATTSKKYTVNKSA